MQNKDRKRYVLRLLGEKSMVSVTELHEALSLSEVSVRKLLASMEREGLLHRTWGGAVSALGSIGEPSYEEKMVRGLAEKKAIAQAAYAFISDGDAVYLDSGTTTLQLAHLLATGGKRRVLVCTNALNVALAFTIAEDMDVLVIGGAFHPRILACSGGLAREMLRTLYFDKAFLTGSHFTVERGFTTPNMQEAEVKRAVMASTKEVFMLADAHKYGSNSLSQIAPTDRMRTLITDWTLPQTVISSFEEKKVRVICAQR